MDLLEFVLAVVIVLAVIGAIALSPLAIVVVIGAAAFLIFHHSQGNRV